MKDNIYSKNIYFTEYLYINVFIFNIYLSCIHSYILYLMISLNLRIYYELIKINKKNLLNIKKLCDFIYHL